MALAPVATPHFPEPQSALASHSIQEETPLLYSWPGTQGSQPLQQPHTGGRQLLPPPSTPANMQKKNVERTQILSEGIRYAQSEAAEHAAIGINIINYAIYCKT